MTNDRCLIKNLRHDGGGVTPEWFYQGSTVFKAFGFPIKNLGNDGGGWIPA